MGSKFYFHFFKNNINNKLFYYYIGENHTELTINPKMELCAAHLTSITMTMINVTNNGTSGIYMHIYILGNSSFLKDQ